jgi:hypothetical protein
MSLLSKEVLDFSSKRLSKNTATALSLCNCKEWGEAGRIQQDWMRTATQDYVAETGRLVNLALKTMADSCRPFEQQDEAAMRTTSAKK